MGQLGDVMRESARIALTYVQSHASELGIDEQVFDGREFHVHVPAGAIPKDGPSAGITMVAAIASLLMGKPVKSTIGMTGDRKSTRLNSSHGYISYAVFCLKKKKKIKK